MKKFIIILLLILSLFVFSQKKILLLYKKTEEYGKYMLQNYVIPILEKNGISYDLKDIETFNYYNISTKEYLGVISWYYSTELKYPNLYLRQLSNFVENNGIFFFFNNLGVSTNQREINNFLNKLGVHYMYGYKVLKNFEPLYEKEFFTATPSTLPQPVEKYKIFEKDVNILLELKSNNETYPLIFISPKGGGALFNSFFDNNKEFILNIEKIFNIFLKKTVGSKNKILLVKDKYDTNYYVNIQYQIEKMLEYAKINFNTTTISTFYNKSFIDLLDYRYIIWITNAKYIDTENTEMFLENGGSIVYITDLHNTPWKDKIKIEKHAISKIIFDKRLFPLTNSKDGIELERTFEENLKIVLDNETILSYLVSSNEKLPAIWYKKEKGGYIGYIYPPLVIKELRGLILQCILEMQDYNIMGFLNSYIFYIDDFPIPSYEIKKKGIKDTDFYYKIWWKDIKDFANSYNIKYTFITPLSYNGASNPPFDFSEFLITDEPIKALMEIDNSKHELGLHGYNHLSLLKENWTNKENLQEGLKSAKKFIESVLGHPIFINSYVAPNNLIDEFGVKNLIKALPEIKTIGTTYTSPDEFSEYKILENFTIIIPRPTYGYYPLKKILLTTINTLSNFGAFQHFIHPDDFFSNERNPLNKSWKELLLHLDKFYYKIKTTFPWLRNQTASEAYPYLFEFLTEKYEYNIKGNSLEVIIESSTIKPKYFLLRTKIPIRKVIGGKIIAFYPENDIYILSSELSKLTIKFLEEEK
ncbi:hypothetical protein SU69_05080 [Thermosipho melanesiensis]|uniref:Uncharacterized protein-like protein n=2 Tax=Thermosipho melanesiensis TaxID=46541 RepID=A6LLQ2_THEM4|nr:DUF2194 domain-containing protein [Thermosipho melanesiensis]ABR30853.1 Uncharacterized protein-like protein [Thermosipho melanesiensis BI429]APT73972.1 hypothetical protein BW47_05315 [Thermosipho melanesiensis]OOC35907.1 hypothetical protein SU68_05135 [Thermosipho melanesiensis]OOC38409.1 hypothetical protein SU69_05080 [Thermosipho melanesiensis]OOC38870.1 hypothetical protein SU70_05080 [Thermosipho melanesiensis]